MSRIEWPALMRAGMHGLGLSPEVFWALTPAELKLMLGDPVQSGPMLSEGLEALMATYPDTRKDTQKEQT